MNPKTFATQRYHFTSIIATQFVQLSINNHSCCLSALVLCKPFIFLLFLFGKSIWYFSVVFLFVFCIYISWDKARKASFLLISNRNAQFFNAFALVLLSLFNLTSFEMQIGKWVSREGERERERARGRRVQLAWTMRICEGKFFVSDRADETPNDVCPIRCVR